MPMFRSHTLPSDARRPRPAQYGYDSVERNTVLTAAILAVVIGAIGLVLAWFASAYYGTIYREAQGTNLQSPPPAVLPDTVPNANTGNSRPSTNLTQHGI